MRTKIIYEDDHILVAHKPPGLATQTAKIGEPDMVSELKNYRKGSPVHLIHRLDQPVEGLLVFAKTKQAAAKLGAQLASGTLEKTYQALVCGTPADEEATLTDYLIKTKQNTAQIVGEDPGQTQSFAHPPQKAVLHYKIRKAGAISLLEIRTETGRFHQIRAQMAHAGWPLLGDLKYGNDTSVAKSRERNITTVALCAYKVGFLHPATGKRLEFCIEPGFLSIL